MGPIQEVVGHLKEPTTLLRREIHPPVIIVTVPTEVMVLLTEAAARTSPATRGSLRWKLR